MEESLRKENTRIRDRLAALRCRNALDHVAVSCYDPIVAANQHTEQAKHFAPVGQAPTPTPLSPPTENPVLKPIGAASQASSRRKEPGHHSKAAALPTPTTTEHTSVTMTTSTSHSVAEPPSSAPPDVMAAMKTLIRTVLEDKEETVTRVNCYRALQKYALAQAEIRKLTAELRKLKREKSEAAAATRDSALSNERIQTLSLFLQDLETIQREQKLSFHMAMEAKDALLKQHQEALTHRETQVEVLTRQLDELQSQSARYEEEIRQLHAALQQSSSDDEEQAQVDGPLNMDRVAAATKALIISSDMKAPRIAKTDDTQDDAVVTAFAVDPSNHESAKLLRSWRNELASDQTKKVSLPEQADEGKDNRTTVFCKLFEKSPIPIETALSYSHETEHSLQDDELFLDNKAPAGRKSPLPKAKPSRSSSLPAGAMRQSLSVGATKTTRRNSPVPPPVVPSEDSELSLKSEEIFLGSTPPKLTCKKPIRKSPAPPPGIGESDVILACGELTACPALPKPVQTTVQRPLRGSPVRPPIANEDSLMSMKSEELFVESSPPKAVVGTESANRKDSETSVELGELFLASPPKKLAPASAKNAITQKSVTSAAAEITEVSMESIEVFTNKNNGNMNRTRSPAPSALRAPKSPIPKASEDLEVSEVSLECEGVFDLPSVRTAAFSRQVTRKGSPIPPRRASPVEEGSIDESLQDFHFAPDQNKTAQSPKPKIKRTEESQNETAPESPSITSSFVPVPQKAVSEVHGFVPLRKRPSSTKILRKSPAPLPEVEESIQDPSIGSVGKDVTPIRATTSEASLQDLDECDDELDLDDFVLSKSNIDKQRLKYGSESSLQSELFDRPGSRSPESSLGGIQEPVQPSSDSDQGQVEQSHLAAATVMDPTPSSDSDQREGERSRSAAATEANPTPDSVPEPDESTTIDSVTGVSYLVNSDGAFSDLLPEAGPVAPSMEACCGDETLPQERVADPEISLRVVEASEMAGIVESIEHAPGRSETASPSFGMDSLRFLNASAQDSGIRHASAEFILMDSAPPEHDGRRKAEATLVTLSDEEAPTAPRDDGGLLQALATDLEKSRVQCGELQQEVESLMFQLENKQVKLHEMESLQDELRETKAALELSQRQIVELEAIVEEQEAGLAQARHKINLLEAYVVEDLVPPDDVVSECMRSLGDRRRTESSLSSKNWPVDREVDSAKDEAYQATIVDLQSQLSAAQALISALEEDRRALAAKATDFEAVLLASRDNQKRLAEKTEKCAGLAAERDRLKQKLHQARGRALDLEQELERTQNVMEELQLAASTPLSVVGHASLAELRDERDRTLARATETSLELAECRMKLDQVSEQLKNEQRRTIELEASLAEMDRSANTRARGGGMFSSLNLSNHSASAAVGAGRLLTNSSHGSWRPPVAAADSDAIIRRLQQRIMELEMQNDIYEAERSSYKDGCYTQHDET